MSAKHSGGRASEEPLAFRPASDGCGHPILFEVTAFSARTETEETEPPVLRRTLTANPRRPPWKLKLTAVRAAFKAGVTPSRIARQFGLSQSDVRKALAADHSGEEAPTA